MKSVPLPAPCPALQQALAAHGKGDLKSARTWYDQAVDAPDGAALAWLGRGVLRFQTGDRAGGIVDMETALDRNPHDDEAWSNLANAYRAEAQFEAGAECARRAVELNPRQALAHGNLAACLRPLGDLVEARAHAEEAVRLAPELNSGWRTLGAVWLHMGDARRASDCFYRALQLDPALPDAWSEWLFALQYRDDISSADILEATRLWSRSQPSAAPGASPSTIRRIGLVSGDFRAHPVGRMMLAFVPALRALGVDVVLIANQSQMDGVTEQLQDAASAWHNVWALPTETACSLVRRENLDLLGDLSGHSADHRLDIFAARCAPFQVSWLGYSATTGVPAMDAWMGCPWTMPEGTEATATEALLRLPSVFTCDSRAPQSVPAGPRDHVVFGSFNNLAKLSDTTIALWSAVLAGIPDSRMILKYRGLGDPALAGALVARFEANGIDASRIECRDWTEEADVNAAFADVDIMLDTFPYSGATTTLDALQRGVPVVTMVSDRYAGRMSAAFLTAYGAEYLITSTPEDYVECAVHLALDGARRQQLREELPRRGATSSVHQPQQFATEWLATVQSLAQERAA